MRVAINVTSLLYDLQTTHPSKAQRQKPMKFQVQRSIVPLMHSLIQETGIHNPAIIFGD